MQIIPIRTRRLNPPQDDLLSVIKDSVTDVNEGDVVVITSKVVAIDEGCTVPYDEEKKLELMKQEADFYIDRPYAKTPLTSIHHAFIGSSGIDESNANGHYVLLPKDLFASAKRLYDFIKENYRLNNFGVIISDSHSGPFRFGATGIALSWWGIKPTLDHRGRPDLFGRKIVFEKSNVVDPLASIATLAGGEVDESTPIVIVRGVPSFEYTDQNTKDELFIPYEEDMFRVLFEKYLP